MLVCVQNMTLSINIKCLIKTQLLALLVVIPQVSSLSTSTLLRFSLKLR